MFYVWSTTGTRTAIFGQVEDDCGPGVSSSTTFLFLKKVPSDHLFLSSYFIFRSSFVQYAVYEHVLSGHANIILLMFIALKPANVWVNHCLSDLCTDCCSVFYLFFFSSKKEIKSAGTEKWKVVYFSFLLQPWMLNAKCFDVFLELHDRCILLPLHSTAPSFQGKAIKKHIVFLVI